MPMESGFSGYILHLSLFLFFHQGHLCALCLHRGFCAVSLCKDALVFAPAKPVYYGYGNQQNAPQKTAVLCDTGKGEFIMARVYNFSAGPSMLPEKVLKQAQAELLEYGDSGQSVMEMSHRSKWFDAIIKDTEATLRRVMNIPDNYKVGFFQGGATQQFAMVPLNFMTTGKADYLVTGNFSNLAAKEAAKKGMRVYMLGIGDPNGAPIPQQGSSNYILDEEGNVVVSKLNEDMCREIAKAGNGSYIYVDNSSSAQVKLNEQINRLAKTRMESQMYNDYDEQFQGFVLLGLMFLLLDIMLQERENQRFNFSKIFSRRMKS